MIREHPSTILYGHPKVAERIGYFFAQFAVVEWELDFAFDLAIGPYQPARELFFGPRDGIRQKTPQMKEVLRRLMPESPLATVLEGIKSELDELTKFRNALAHGIYGETENHDVRVSRTGKERDLVDGYPISVETMDDWLNRLKSIGSALSKTRPIN